MTWSYNGDPSSSTKDAVRFVVGLTDTNEQFLSDEEIQYLIDQNGGPLPAAVEAARKVAAQLSREADTTVGDQKVALSQRADQYRRVAQDLQRQIALAAAPLAGGISEDDKDAQEDRSDRVEPFFKREMHKNEG